jgi:hypothetical protein
MLVQRQHSGSSFRMYAVQILARVTRLEYIMVYRIGFYSAEQEENKFVTRIVCCIHTSAITNLYLQHVTTEANEMRKIQKQTRLENIPMH